MELRKENFQSKGVPENVVQTELDFAYVERREAAAKESHVLYPEKIEEYEPGKWRFIESKQDIKEWDELNSGSNEDYYPKK